MTLLRICECSGLPDGANAELSFDHIDTYPITVTNPFSEQEEGLLEWYFERWLEVPFMNEVHARTAAQSTVVYGERLFRQVFADHRAYARYKQIDFNALRIEVAGSPEFHALHWEAVKDPDLPQPLALRAPMVRKHLRPQPVQAAGQVSPTINLLVVTARPDVEKDVGYRTISRPLVESLRQTKVPVRIDILRPGTFEALVRHLEETTDRHGDGYYHIIHFDVHGALLSYAELQQGFEGNRLLYQARYGRADLVPYEGEKAFLFLEGEEPGKADPVEAGELARRLIDYQIPVAILNACQSGKQVGATETSLGSRLMQAGVQTVLAMGYSITVSAARRLMETLYRQLFDGKALSVAIRRARQELYNQKARRAYFNRMIDLEDWLLPVVYERQERSLATRPFTPEENKVWYERQAAQFKPPAPTYGFVGRDLDVLRIEKHLLKHNLLLVHGMGGAGKTTLLRHLGYWWQTTRFVDQVFYFGYDEKAWTREQIMDGIARQLLDKVEYYGSFQPLPVAAQQQLLASRLASHRHLLILDNLESITGSQLAIRNTLTAEEQNALADFLGMLVGGRTLVLLGSRSGEDWLADGTFGNSVYELGGLDPEAASDLADSILKRHNATRYREDEAFKELLKLLDGYPLPMEVVLANLARQTPGEVLKALKAGDVALDSGDSQDKTRSILRCIEYSHSNLSAQAQGLLNCLAPFTGVVNVRFLPRYTEQLKQQPALASLPFERWQEVLQEAVNWGLLSPHSEISIFLQLQPIFPYFLRSRLQGQAEIKSAVETAFRRHYDEIGYEIYQLLDAKEAEQKQLGQVLARVEYENLTTALDLALATQESILYFS